MKQLNCIYTRLIICLLALVISNVAWGQDIIVPIKTVTADPAQVAEGDAHRGEGHDHKVANIIDSNPNTMWIGDQTKEFHILDFLQLTNVDDSDNGLRTRIELPYVPNANTEIEIKFQNTYTYNDPTHVEYLFGCGVPESGSGMSFGILNGNYTYRVSKHRQDNLRATDTNVHTLISNSKGTSLDGASLCDFGSYEYTSDNNNLCFFASPNDDVKYTRCYKGKIYSVKIREKGLLKYDLQPATYNGRPGFYDRISTNFYMYSYERLSYIQNTNRNPNLHIKVPLMPEPDNNAFWSNSLVQNGHFVTGNLNSFSGYALKVDVPQPIVVNENNTKALKVTSSQRVSDSWDSQLMIELDEPLLPGDKYYIAFDYKTANGISTDVQVQAHQKPGEYNSGFLQNIHFTPEWQRGTWTGTISDNQGRNGGMGAIAFNLNVREEATDYYITNVVVKKQVSTSPYKKWSGNLALKTQTKFTTDGNSTHTYNEETGELTVVCSSSNAGSNAWDRNLRIFMDQAVNRGERYTISFQYKASRNVRINSFILNADGSPYGYTLATDALNFTTEWKTGSWTNTVPNPDSDAAAEFGRLGFNLNEAGAPETTFSFKDIVIRRELDEEATSSDPVPDTGMKWSKNMIKNGNFITDDLSSFGPYYNATVSRDVKNDALQIITPNRPDGQNAWYSQFFIKVPQNELKSGDKVYISFSYQADKAAATNALFQYSEGDQNPIGPDPFNFTTAWQTFSQVVTVPNNNKTVNQLCFHLSRFTQANTYRIKDVVVKKMIPIATDEDNPSLKLEIRFKDNNPERGETYSHRYLFSLGAHENEVLAMNSLQGQYEFTSGGTLTKTNYGIDNNNEIRATFESSICNFNGATYNVTGSPNWRDADALYLFGTHCIPNSVHNNYAPRSFDGQIYEVVLTENGIKRLDLCPAINANSEYGFVDKQTMLFYGLDGCVNNVKLTGSPAMTGLETGAQEQELKMPFKIDFTTDSHIARDFTITTGYRESDENQVNHNNPRKWVLYASNDGESWKKLEVSMPNSTQAPNNTDPSLTLNDNSTAYKFRILNNTEAFTRYRLVVEQVITKNEKFSRLRLGDLSLSTNYTFAHYYGRVYDEANIPNSLKVGGSSGYTSEWKTNTDDVRLNPSVQIQRTHEYEHEVYVLPGETVDLTPFSDFDIPNVTNDDAYNNAYNYQDQYIRWYDYNTDLRSDRLTFDKRNGHSVSELNWGHFSWNHRNDGIRTREGSLAHYNTSSDATGDANGVIDVIAIEAANKFGISDNTTWDGNSYVIKEPTLQWRHLFVIKDAKTRSDAMYSNNANYIESHKITLMCPANTPFQYPLPYHEYASANNSHHTDYYYRNGNNYEPVHHYLIETWQNGTKLGETKVGDDVANGNEQLAYSYKAIANYNRVFYVRKPQEGTYTIKIYALDDNAKNADGGRLQIMEYELQVLSPENGVMVNAETLMSDSYQYELQRPTNMDLTFGKPTTKIDFDDVTINDRTDSIGYHYYKWPWQWENSSYGFGYEDRGDYNMYMVADHMSITPYKGREQINRKDDIDGLDVFDRHYYDTNGAEPGYFFYANAASDPSRMAVLNIGKDFCPNTKVYVSAWINEFQCKKASSETANVIFSFRGVKADGTEVVLNSFVSGYVSGGWNTPNGYVESKKADDFVNATTNPDNRGKWMHIYYTFTTGNDAEGFDHYIITMENNCTSSEGADYAIDDIRAYVRKPQVKADQLKPVCNGEPSTDLKVFGDFDQLKDAFVLDEKTGDESEIVTFNYCFLDRDLYENELKKQYNESSNINKTIFTTFEAWREDLKLHTNNYENEYRAAFNKALIKESYGSGSNEYGTFRMNTNYEKNPLYEYAEGFHPDYYNIAQRQQVGSVRNIIFPCNATDEEMLVGSRYIISMIKAPGRTPTPLDFDLEDKCKSVSDFSVLFSGEIKIDGTLRSDANDLRFCVNQVPVITIDLNGISEGGQPVKTEEAYFDWFFDTRDNYYQATAPNETYITDAIANFRTHYPNMTQEDFAVKALPQGEGDGAFTLVEKECIQYFLDNGMLVLYKNSETMSTYDRYMEMANANNNMQLDVTAIPINPHPEDLSIHYCLDPIGISLKLSERKPSMLNGDDSGNIPYPTTMKNVPLRIGLKQLNRVRISNLNESTTPSGILYMPLREVHPYTQGVKSLIQIAEDQLIYLVSSTDPDIAANRSGAINVESDKKTNVKVIGKVSNITASSENDKKAGNVCHLSFIDAFKFREGYEYTIKFHFEENYTEIQGSHEDVCPGDVVCTIKVVPEYQMWTGEIDANWNNDGNWRRVTKDELLGTAAATEDFVIDGGTNDNKNSFVPADFTKVIIPADARNVPKLYNVRTANNQTEVHYAGAPVSSSSNFIKDIDAHEANDLIGKTTTDIKFDMASIDRADQNVATRSYYDNTCEQIHFNSGAQMLSQQYLYYEKAWADFEVEPNKWSTVASPLTNVVSGDLYLPTDGARQMTPLFEDITFNVTDHDRFNPAVFQRRWNAESAKVVHLDGSKTSSIIALDWSEVYNDVNVNYTAGVGFSIKPDVSMMPADKRPEKVKFRLPKADKQYDYWNPNHEDTPHNTEVVRSENDSLINGERTHRLADLSNVYAQQVVQNGNTTNYFLVGNPLMCYLDMKRFFDANTDLERNYWIVTGKGQQYAQFDENTEGYVGTVGDAYVAPFQSFFVKLANTSASTFTPKFNSDMMVALIKDPQGAQRYESVTEQKSADSPVKQFALSLCASDEEGNESVAILTDGAELPTAGLEALFDSNLKMSGYPMLYTNIKGEAMSLAQIMPGDTIPVAMSNVKGNVTLRLTGADTFTTPLYIIDAETGENSLLDGDITLTQSENGVRYYIATDPTGIETEMETLLPQIVTKDGVLTIKANGNEISSIMIHKVDGSLIARDTQPSEVFTIQLPRNVYLIHLICNGKELTYKIAM